MSDRAQRNSSYVIQAVAAVLLAVLLVFGILRDIQVDGESIRDRRELHRLIDEERRQREEERQAYRQRAVIQKALLDEAVKRGAFSPDEVEKLRRAEVGALYPPEAFTGAR